jgi:hypothetical protein
LWALSDSNRRLSAKKFDPGTFSGQFRIAVTGPERKKMQVLAATLLPLLLPQQRSSTNQEPTHRAGRTGTLQTLN